MSYTVMYYHMIWATKHRQKTITSSIETSLIEAIQSKSKNLNSPIHAINTAFDHIHISVSISPNIAVALWVRQVKGFSSYIINREFKDLEIPFRWQFKYCGKTFGLKAVPYVHAYIENQKEHHANNSLDEYLEYTPKD